MLDLVEDADAAGEAHCVHVVEAEVKQVLGSSGDTVALAGDIADQQTCSEQVVKKLFPLNIKGCLNLEVVFT